MSAPCPISYYIDCNRLSDELRRCYFSELADNGGKYVVLNYEMFQNIMRSPGSMNAYAKELADAGLQFADAHAPCGGVFDLHNTGNFEMNKMLMYYKLYIRIAAALNISTLTFHVGSDNMLPELSSEEHTARICRMLDGILPEAEEYGVIVALENSWARSNSADSLLKLKALYPTDNLGFCFDSGHANLASRTGNYLQSPAWERWKAVGYEEPIWENNTLEKLLPHIVNCHLHDNDGPADIHQLPGWGNIDWKKTVSLLRKAPRLKVIQSEVKHFRHCIAIKDLVNTFEKLFADN